MGVIRSLKIDSTTIRAKNVTMVAQGARKGKRQNNVVVYMAFVMVYSKGMGTKSF